MPRTNNSQRHQRPRPTRPSRKRAGRHPSPATSTTSQPEIARALPPRHERRPRHPPRPDTVRKSVVDRQTRHQVPGLLLPGILRRVTPHRERAGSGAGRQRQEAYLVPTGRMHPDSRLPGVGEAVLPAPPGPAPGVRHRPRRRRVRVRKGTAPYLTHKPARGTAARSDAYYAAADPHHGAKPFVVLTPEEVKALRRGKEGPSGDIPDPMRWMERKTALRQLFKLLPKSTTLQVASRWTSGPGRSSTGTA
jgi:hypothetical protein